MEKNVSTCSCFSCFSWHSPLEENFDALEGDGEDKHRKRENGERARIRILGCINDRTRRLFFSFFFSYMTSTSELTLHNPVGSPCGRGKVPGRSQSLRSTPYPPDQRLSLLDLHPAGSLCQTSPSVTRKKVFWQTDIMCDL